MEYQDTIEFETDNIEFVLPKGKSNFRTKKWEFKYLDDIPVPEDIPYRILVMKDKTEMYFKMKRLPPRGNIDFGLVEEYKFAEGMLKSDPINNITLRSQYIDMAGGKRQREMYIKPYKVVLTKRMKESEFFQRYFAKYKLSEFYDKVFEISKQNFGMDTPLYDKVSISWQLKGTKEEILRKNIDSLEKAEEKIWGIRNFLDPLEFYEKEISPEEVLQKKLSKLKFIPGGSEEPLEKKAEKKRQKGSKRGRAK